jgi:hypothetical protein
MRNGQHDVGDTHHGTIPEAPSAMLRSAFPSYDSLSAIARCAWHGASPVATPSA